MRQQVVTSIALVVMVALCASRVAANDFWMRVKVLDCAGQPVTEAAGQYVSLYGCTDSRFKNADGSTPVATTPEISASIGKVINSKGYAMYIDPSTNTPIAIPDEGAKMNCTFTGQPDVDVGLKAEYCFGSADNPCSLAVMTRTGTAATGYTYSRNTDYDVVTGIFASNPDTVTNTGASYPGLKGYVRATYANYLCSSDNAYCSDALPNNSAESKFILKPRAASCAPTCAPCPTTPDLALQSVCGETGYAYMCSSTKFDSTTGKPSTAYPSFISFRSNQKIYASSPSLAIRGNNWGWMAYWPTTYVTNAPSSCNAVNGYIFAGQDSPAGTVTASVTKSDTKYTLNYSIDLSAAGNKLTTVHVYTSCSILTNPAPGQFGNTVVFNPPVATYAGTASTPTLCAGDFLYVAIHVAIL